MKRNLPSVSYLQVWLKSKKQVLKTQAIFCGAYSVLRESDVEMFSEQRAETFDNDDVELRSTWQSGL